MKRLFLIIVLTTLSLSCTIDKKNNMIVKGQVKNLKKGTLYLQKVLDTVLIDVDSVKLESTENFTLTDKVESPEIYYLTLDKLPSKQLSFFGEEGTITIDVKLEKFNNLFAKIEGLTNQKLLDEYNTMKSQYSGKRLDLVKEDFNAKKEADSARIDSIKVAIENLIKSKYRYTANFIVTHPDQEVAPFLALTEFYDANITWLDSINNSLTPKVKSSKYGKQLDAYIQEVKEK